MNNEDHPRNDQRYQHCQHDESLPHSAKRKPCPPLSESPHLAMRQDENKQQHHHNGAQHWYPEEAP